MLPKVKQPARKTSISPTNVLVGMAFLSFVGFAGYSAYSVYKGK